MAVGINIKLYNRIILNDFNSILYSSHKFSKSVAPFNTSFSKLQIRTRDFRTYDKFSKHDKSTSGSLPQPPMPRCLRNSLPASGQ
jgi:hypothetical protein